MTNQNKDYSWLDSWKPIFVNGVIPPEFKAAIDEHYIGKGEASENLRAVFAAQLRAAAADRHTFKGDTQAWIGVTADCMASTAESEVEQRCIEARIDTLEMVKTTLSFEGIKLSDEQSASIDAWIEQLKPQLSTNNKDTLERSSDDR